MPETPDTSLHRARRWAAAAALAGALLGCAPSDGPPGVSRVTLALGAGLGPIDTLELRAGERVERFGLPLPGTLTLPVVAGTRVDLEVLATADARPYWRGEATLSPLLPGELARVDVPLHAAAEVRLSALPDGARLRAVRGANRWTLPPAADRGVIGAVPAGDVRIERALGERWVPVLCADVAQGETLQAALSPVPGEETCNGLDDDCDGLDDDGVTNACGACGDVPAETCNGLDDDCDGLVDDGVANACGACGDVPAETCNGVDDDCDGLVDDGVTNACGACGDVPAETCNSLDDDCDGLVDDGVTNACGACGDVPAETCNGLDDDCDGVLDEVAGLARFEAGGEAAQVAVGAGFALVSGVGGDTRQRVVTLADGGIEAVVPPVDGPVAAALWTPQGFVSVHLVAGALVATRLDPRVRPLEPTVHPLGLTGRAPRIAKVPWGFAIAYIDDAERAVLLTLDEAFAPFSGRHVVAPPPVAGAADASIWDIATVGSLVGVILSTADGVALHVFEAADFSPIPIAPPEAPEGTYHRPLGTGGGVHLSALGERFAAAWRESPAGPARLVFVDVKPAAVTEVALPEAWAAEITPTDLMSVTADAVVLAAERGRDAAGSVLIRVAAQPEGGLGSRLMDGVRAPRLGLEEDATVWVLRVEGAPPSDETLDLVEATELCP
jgi:hypothetical protein